MNNYNTSRDYELLWEFVNNQHEILCTMYSSMITHENGKLYKRCAKIFRHQSEQDKKTFISYCKRQDLEFILPNAWISVKDGLPKLHKNVLTYSTSDGIGVSCLTIYGWTWTSNVTHWQPLPEAPKN